MADIKVSIGADTMEFDRKLKSLKSTIGGLAGALGVGLSVGAGTAAMKSLIDNLDEVGKKAKNLGLSTDFVQKLSYAAEISGASFEAVVNGIKYMEKNISEAKMGLKEAKQSFEMMNIPLEDLEKLSPEEQFQKIAQALSTVGNQSDKTAIAMQVFGRTGDVLIDMMSNYASLAKELEESGAIIKSEDIAAAEAFNDALTRIGKSLTAIVTDSGFVAWLSKVVEGFEATLTVQNKLGAKTGAGSNRAAYRGGVSGFFANLKEAYFGEAEGEVGTTYVTEAEKKKLEKSKEEFEKTGKTKRQRTDEERAAAQEKINAENLRKEKEKQEEAQRKLDDRTRDKINDLQKEVELQELKNKGLEREAAIERALYDAKKQNKNLTEEQARQIAEAAGKLYDLGNIEKEKKGKKEKEFELPYMDEITNQFLRVGAYMGGGGDAQQKQYQAKQLGLLEAIKENTKNLSNSFELT